MQFNVLIKQSFRMKFRRLPTQLEETANNMSSSVQTMLRRVDGVAVTQCVEVALKKRQRLEKRGRYLVQDGVFLSVEGLLEVTESRKTEIFAENLVWSDFS